MENIWGDLYIMYGTYKKEAGINSYCNEWKEAFEMGVLEESLDELKVDLISDCGYSYEDFLGADEYYDLGIEKFNNKNYTEAINLFNNSFLKSENDYDKKDYKTVQMAYV